MNQSPLVFEVTADNFDTAVLEKSRRTLVAVGFWADWCAPSRAPMPLLQRREYQGKLLLTEVNSDERQELAARRDIQSLPAIFVMVETDGERAHHYRRKMAPLLY